MTLLKKIYIITLFTLLAIFPACEDFEDDRLKFEETAAPSYVKFTSVTKKTVVEGQSLEIQVDTPLQPYEDITVNYEVTGDYATTGSVVIPAGSRDATFELTIPENKSSNEVRTSTVKITSASGGFTAGRAGVNTSFVLDILDDAKSVGFGIDSTGGFEVEDTVNVMVDISSAADSKVTVHYVITGGDEGVDYEDASNGVLEIAPGTNGDTIQLVILDNIDRNDPPTTLEIEIQSIDVEDGDDEETLLDDDASIFKYTIVDDLKYVAFADGDVIINDLEEEDGVGVHSFDVTLTGSTDSPVTVNYTVTGSGVTNLTGGSITFYPNSVSTKQIEVQLGTAAFDADQTITIKLTTVTSTDDEAVVGDTGTTVQIKTKS